MMPRKHDRLNARNLTVQCPGCKRFWFMHRNQWPSKKSGGCVSCTDCGTFVPSREWRLASVPWLRLVA